MPTPIPGWCNPRLPSPVPIVWTTRSFRRRYLPRSPRTRGLSGCRASVVATSRSSRSPSRSVQPSVAPRRDGPGPGGGQQARSTDRHCRNRSTRPHRPCRHSSTRHHRPCRRNSSTGHHRRRRRPSWRLPPPRRQPPPWSDWSINRGPGRAQFRQKNPSTPAMAVPVPAVRRERRMSRGRSSPRALELLDGLLCETWSGPISCKDSSPPTAFCRPSAAIQVRRGDPSDPVRSPLPGPPNADLARDPKRRSMLRR
jgi:hypothetical protein